MGFFSDVVSNPVGVFDPLNITGFGIGGDSILGGGGGGGTPQFPKIKTPTQLLQDALGGILGSQEQLGQLRESDVQRQLDILREFAPQFEQQLTGLRDTRAQADLLRVAQLAPQLRELEDPQTRAIRQQLGQQVQTELSRGSALTPGEIRELQQGTRAASGARGIQFGARPIAEEAFTRGLAAQQRSEQRRVSRQQLAMEFLRTQATTQVEPIATVQNLASGATQSVNLANQQGFGENLLGGLFGAAQTQGNLQAQTQFGVQQLQAQQAASRQQGIFSLLGTGAGAFFGGGLGGVFGGGASAGAGINPQG